MTQIYEDEYDVPMVFQYHNGKVIDCGPVSSIEFANWHVDFESLNYFVAVVRLEAYSD